MMALDDAECSGDEVTFPKEVINRYIGHSIKCTKTLNMDLQVIAKQIKKNAYVEKDFIDTFPEWELYRKKSVACLTDMIKELDSIHFNTNVAKTTGFVSGIISGCIGIAGVVATLAGYSSADALQLTASIGGLLSSATSNGAAITEAGLSQSFINKAKRLLREDLERFEAIQEWFEHTTQLKLAIGRVCNFNVMTEVFQKLIMIVPQMKKTCDIFSSYSTEVINQVVEVVRCKNISNIDIEKIILLCDSVCRDPRLLESITNILQVIQNSPTMLPVVTTLFKVHCEKEFLMNYFCNTNGKCLTNGNTSVNQAVTYGLFQGVNVALESVSLSYVIDDFQNGSPSQYAASIREVRNKLELQLVLVADVYKMLKNTN